MTLLPPSASLSLSMLRLPSELEDVDFFLPANLFEEIISSSNNDTLPGDASSGFEQKAVPPISAVKFQDGDDSPGGHLGPNPHSAWTRSEALPRPTHFTAPTHQAFMNNGFLFFSTKPDSSWPIHLNREKPKGTGVFIPSRLIPSERSIPKNKPRKVRGRKTKNDLNVDSQAKNKGGRSSKTGQNSGTGKEKGKGKGKGKWKRKKEQASACCA